MNKELLNQLQKNTGNIRNFCILAHVDHGKTTLADTLLASNGIISSRMSGKLRYMDSRPDEQERGITMKSSAISLVHTRHSQTHSDQKYLLNLIDSPGHVDFSSEVSTAIRLCDGALILIDVCEGICPQTHAVLRQASVEQLKLVLVLNKVDRLITELKMTPLEAYYHLVAILEQFNALVAQQFSSLMTERIYRMSEEDLEADGMVEWADEDESKIYFSPKYNNVFFASAIDGWGFSIENFADIYATKLGFKKEILMQTLWGDYYMNAKTKRIMKDAQSKAKRPLFVQFVLENIWQIYESVYVRRDVVMMDKIIKSLGIKMLPRDMKFTDPKVPLQALLSNWLPLGRNLINMVIDILPSPLAIGEDKVEHLICHKLVNFKSLPPQTQALKQDFLTCSANSEEAPVIAFISKMFAVDKEVLNKRTALTLAQISVRREAIRLKKLAMSEQSQDAPANSVTFSEPIAEVKAIEEPEEEEEEEEEEEQEKHEFMAFARVFSGTLKKGSTVYVLSPKHRPEDFIGQKAFDVSTASVEELQEISKHCTKVTLADIYLMMGRDLELIDQVPCGNICAIGGLEALVQRSATLATTLFCPSFSGMFMQTSAIVRVAIEPKDPRQLRELARGLRLLNQSDPCVEVLVQENGEHILCTAGEVHLQRCVDDLVERFACVQVNTSPPLIPFRETIVRAPELDNAREKIVVAETGARSTEGKAELQSADKRVTVATRAKPLPDECTRFLEESTSQLRLLNRLNQTKTCEDPSALTILSQFREQLTELLAETGWQVQRIMAFGPNSIGPNVLFNMVDGMQTNVWTVLDRLLLGKDTLNGSPTAQQASAVTGSLKEYEGSVLFGFNLASSKGPLCEEPMQGVAFFFDKFALTELAKQPEDSVNEAKKPSPTSALASSSSQFITLIQNCLKKSFEQQHQRLMAAMYKCEIMTVSSEALGKLYAVLGKRNAKITDEAVKEGTSMFIISAFLPVSESFGLAEEIRKKTSGLASPHIQFSHFEVIDIDPYWEPETEEELLLYGDKADTENQAKRWMYEVRKRKGLFVKEKLVQDAEKQRTLRRE